jgi:hypothetical protein
MRKPILYFGIGFSFTQGNRVCLKPESIENGEGTSRTSASVSNCAVHGRDAPNNRLIQRAPDADPLVFRIATGAKQRVPKALSSFGYLRPVSNS